MVYLHNVHLANIIYPYKQASVSSLLLLLSFWAYIWKIYIEIHWSNDSHLIYF